MVLPCFFFRLFLSYGKWTLGQKVWWSRTYRVPRDTGQIHNIQLSKMLETFLPGFFATPFFVPHQRNWLKLQKTFGAQISVQLPKQYSITEMRKLAVTNLPILRTNLLAHTYCALSNYVLKESMQPAVTIRRMLSYCARAVMEQDETKPSSEFPSAPKQK